MGGLILLCCLAKPFGRASTGNVGGHLSGARFFANRAAQSLLIESPAERRDSLFFARCHFLCDSSHRNSSVPAIAGCRLTTGYLAVLISDPVARPSGPLNSQPRRLCRRAQLAAAFARQARSSSGGERYAHSQHGCKVSRHPFDSGKDRPAWLGWTPGPIQKYLSAAPVDVSTANISFRVLAFEAVARIG